MRRTSRLLLVVGLSLAALSVVTATLVHWYHRERTRRAAAHSGAGRAYAAADEAAQAVREYRAALLLERGDFEAERGLAFALLELGRFDEAEAYLTDLLQREPTSGPLNLGMARVRAAGDAVGEARRLYQRAIYGEWPEQQADRRALTRFELAEYLSAQGSREDVLAELLRLKTELGAGDVAAQRRLARLLQGAGAADVAADVLASAAENAPRDVTLLSELAGAQALAGRPADARRTLRRALAIDPGRRDLRDRLTIVDRVLTLDPTLPNLRITTRTRRARELLRAVVDQTAACESDAASGAAAALRREAQARLRSRAVSTPGTAEEDLTASVRLWGSAAACRSDGADAEAISRVIERVELGLEDPPP